MTLNVSPATVTLRYENILLRLRQPAGDRNRHSPTARWWLVFFFGGGPTFLIEIDNKKNFPVQVPEPSELQPLE